MNPILIQAKINKDLRGGIVKTYHTEVRSLLPDVKEVFITTNIPSVARGYHYQEGMNRAVFCERGEIVDMLINRNTGERRHYILKQGQGIYIPNNWGHGFYSPYGSVVCYITDKEWDPMKEGGFKIIDDLMELFKKYCYDGVPVLSERDQSFLKWEQK